MADQQIREALEIVMSVTDFVEDAPKRPPLIDSSFSGKEVLIDSQDKSDDDEDEEKFI